MPNCAQEAVFVFVILVVAGAPSGLFSREARDRENPAGANQRRASRPLSLDPNQRPPNDLCARRLANLSSSLARASPREQPPIDKISRSWLLFHWRRRRRWRRIKRAATVCMPQAVCAWRCMRAIQGASPAGSLFPANLRAQSGRDDRDLQAGAGVWRRRAKIIVPACELRFPKRQCSVRKK